ncbi:MAG: type VI secretion system-associated protein TagF [Roseibium sp.]
MGCGYFGKLPARSDYVTGHCPNGFLKLWEPFVMQGLARSRLDLGKAWQEAYMTMPVWRFELRSADTEENLPTVVLGAFMPSVDGVGREYPLTVVAEPCHETGEGANDWYDRVETVLRSALYEDADLARFRDSVEGLPSPGPVEDKEVPEPQAVLSAAPGEGRIGASRFWCRGGGVSFSFRCGGLPHPAEFRWLLLPEQRPRDEGGSGEAGDHHGRYHPEDHRT